MGDIGESKRKIFSEKFVFYHQYAEQFLRQCWFIDKSSRSQMFYRMGVLELQNSQEAPVAGFLFFKEIALPLFVVYKFIKKEALAQLSSYEFCEIFKKTIIKNIFEHLFNTL